MSTCQRQFKEERLRWILSIVNHELALNEVTRVCPHSQQSIERWVVLYKKQGETGLILKSTRPKTNPNETPIRIKERVVELRKKTKKCSLKLNQKIIKKEGLVRRYRIRKLKYKYIKVPLGKGELVEIDMKYMPKTVENKQYYQFTAIDCVQDGDI